MRHLVLFLLTSLALGAAPLRAATNGDPGDLFVGAYMSVQQGEKAEEAGNFKAALTKFRYAATVLDQLANTAPTWQPKIVEYRKTRTTEAIVRVQEKIARFGAGKTDPGEAPTGLPPLPQMDNGEKPLIFETPDPVLRPPQPRRQRRSRRAPLRAGQPRSGPSTATPSKKRSSG